MRPIKMKPPQFAVLAVPIAAILSACSPANPAAEALRPVRTVEVRYGDVAETNRYVGTVQARHQVDQSFRVGGKVVQRKVEVGQAVREGDVIAVLDDTDYRLAEEAARQQLDAAISQARQAESDRQRLEALRHDGSVSPADSERAETAARTTKAAAEAQKRALELARNRLKYTVLRASQSGVVTAVRFEVGQVVAEGMPVLSIANQVEPEIVVDVPELQVDAFRKSRYRASVSSASDETFDVVLRELAPQAAAQTRTYRARLKPAEPRELPLGATATLMAMGASADGNAAAVPAVALTQSNGRPAVWVVRRDGSDASGAVELVPVEVRAYRNDDVLIAGPKAGDLVVAAGVQKMAPGLRVALAPAELNARLTQVTR
jgi:RND family efflux transporter MFP subunit